MSRIVAASGEARGPRPRVGENLGQSPTILILDESGLVRWHSEGVQDPRILGSEVRDPEQATIIAAIMFALEL